MTTPEYDQGTEDLGSGRRRHIPAATQAALWALGNRRCYFPGCPQPLVVEIRPGVYRKNAIMSHIYGVKPRAPRHRRRLGDDERDSFTNLILLCLPHSEEIDDPVTGEERYPAETLHEWKRGHEGTAGTTLAALGVVSEEQITTLLTAAFTPPLDRLQQITDELAQTGELTASTVEELRLIVVSLADHATGFDARTIAILSSAADVFGSSGFINAAMALDRAAEILPGAIRNLRRYPT